MKNFKELRETIKKGDVFTKKEALKYFKKERKDFKPSDLVTFENKGGKEVNHWKDKETGELVPMKESVELDEAANVKSTMSDLNKKMGLLKTDVKSGNVNDIITRMTAIEIFMGKAIKDLNKLVKEDWKKKKKNEDCGVDHDSMKKKKMKKHMDDVHEDELEEVAKI